MHAAYSPEPWHDLFVGVASAAAALTGLLFVSPSINLQPILGQPWLPRRAALTLLLFQTLVVAILGLAPGQSRTTLGVELLAGILLLLGYGTVNAWILLVEILR